jgi:hypothetical protein
MKRGRSIVDLANELTRQQSSKRDLPVPSRLWHFETSSDSSSQVIVEEPTGPVRYGITELARRQLADRLKIPFAYFERCRQEQPALLDRNVNTWLHSEAQGSEHRMLRTLDGRVRAVLSPRYRRLDNFELAEHVLPMLRELPQVRFESLELTETRLYLKVVTPRVEYEVAPGDIVQAGVAIGNSEVGCGTLSVQPLVYRLLCRNGLIAPERGLRRRTHVGRLLDGSDDSIELFKDDTLMADDRAFFLKVRDVVQAAVSEATFVPVAEKMKATLGITLKGDLVKTVEMLANRYALNDDERGRVLRRLIGDADLTGYGLINAVTGASQDVVDYDRATELETLGGRMIDLSAREWKELAEAN